MILTELLNVSLIPEHGPKNIGIAKVILYIPDVVYLCEKLAVFHAAPIPVKVEVPSPQYILATVVNPCCTSILILSLQLYVTLNVPKQESTRTRLQIESHTLPDESLNIKQTFLVP